MSFVLNSDVNLSVITPNDSLYSELVDKSDFVIYKEGISYIV